MSLIKKYIKFLIQILSTILPGFLRVITWKALGFKIGKRSKIGIFSIIIVDDLEIGDDVTIDSFTMIIFLSKCKIGHMSRVSYFTKIYGPGTFIAETRCLVSVQCLIECFSECQIIMKNYSCFGPRNTIYTHGGYLPVLQGFPSKHGDVIINQYSWTGMLTTILPGTNIGSYTIISPGCVLTGTIPEKLFIRSNSYKYDKIPIEDKMIIRSQDEIISYIKNIIYYVIKEKYNKTELKKFDFFIKQRHDTPYIFYGKEIIILNNSTDDVLYDKNVIIVGYGLEKKMKSNQTLIWLDFKNYSANGRQNKILNILIQRLYKSFNLKFLFVD